MRKTLFDLPQKSGRIDLLEYVGDGTDRLADFQCNRGTVANDCRNQIGGKNRRTELSKQSRC